MCILIVGFENTLCRYGRPDDYNHTLTTATTWKPEITLTLPFATVDTLKLQTGQWGAIILRTHPKLDLFCAAGVRRSEGTSFTVRVTIDIETDTVDEYFRRSNECIVYIARERRTIRRRNVTLCKALKSGFHLALGQSTYRPLPHCIVRWDPTISSYRNVGHWLNVQASHASGCQSGIKHMRMCGIFSPSRASFEGKQCGMRS